MSKQFDPRMTSLAQLPVSNKYSHNIRTKVDPSTQREVLHVRTANGELKAFEHLNSDNIVLPFPKAGAAELGKTERFFAKATLGTFRAPVKGFKKSLPLAINLGMAGLGGFGAYELAKLVVLAIAPHAAHAVLLGVSIAAVGLFAVVVGAYWLHKLAMGPASGQLEAMLQDDHNYRELEKQNQQRAFVRPPMMPATMPSEKSTSYYNVEAGPQEKPVAKQRRKTFVPEAPESAEYPAYESKVSPSFSEMPVEPNSWGPA